jgi:hypothetical protein
MLSRDWTLDADQALVTAARVSELLVSAFVP